MQFFPQWLWLFSAHFLINTCSTFLATSSAIIFFWKRYDPFKQRNSNAKLFLRLYIKGFKLILLCAPHIPHYLLNWATPVSVGVKKLHNCFFYTIRKYVIYKWLQLHIWACETHLDTQVLSHGSVLHADIPALLPFKDTFYIVYFR